MSSCEKYQELISRMVDGDLSPKEKHELASHVENCPSCSALFQAFFTISREVGSDLQEPPTGLRESVMAEIQRGEIRRRNRIPTVLRAVLSAAACVAVIVGVYLGVSLTQGKNLITAAFDTGSGTRQTAAAVQEPVVVPAEETLQERAAAAAAARDEANESEAPLLGSNAVTLPQAEDKDVTAAEAPAVPEIAAPAEEPAVPEIAAPAEEPAPTEEPPPAPEEEAAGEDASEGSAAEAPADNEEVPEDAAEEEEQTQWVLSNWELSLVRELLDGKPVNVSQEAMEPYLIGQLLVENRKQSYTFLLYEKYNVLYYLDPVKDAVFQSSLKPQELLDFLRG